MKNKLSSGDTILWTNGGTAKVSGDVVRIGNLLGICGANIGAGASGIVHLKGEFTVPKVTTAVVAVGEMVLWKAATSNFEAKGATPASGDLANAAIAMTAGANGQTTIVVSLNARFGTLTP